MRLNRRGLIAAALILGAGIAVAAILLSRGGSSQSSYSQTVPAITGKGGLTLRGVGEFDYPLYVATAPGDDNLLFVVDKPGRIEVLSDGQKQDQPFLDLHDNVDSLEGEQGLFSVAFDPGYARNGRFYVDYTNRQGNIEVDQFRRSRESPLLADPSSRRQVIVIEHRQTVHDYGGQLAFHGDHLYVSVGNEGVPGDLNDTAQSTHTLLGKLLRIDPKPGGGYTVPRSNPFVGKPGRDEIFALGLRNPWRFSFDRDTGDLWIADVGYQSWEEIDHIPLAEAKGANFGWNLFEGPNPCGKPCGHSAAAKPPPHYVPPVHVYPHAGSGEHGNVIVGGYVVRDPALPSLDGRYVYTDDIAGDLRAFDPRTRRSTGLGLTVALPTSFGEGVDGRIYVTTLASPGPVYELVAGP